MIIRVYLTEMSVDLEYTDGSKFQKSWDFLTNNLNKSERFVHNNGIAFSMQKVIMVEKLVKASKGSDRNIGLEAGK